VAKRWTVVDLFSGAGGMSYGFHAHPGFRIVGAVDAQLGKPSSPPGALECNGSYEANIGVTPFSCNLLETRPENVVAPLAPHLKGGLTVLCSCAPCTGFSRTLSRNHLADDTRNSLIGRSAQFVRLLNPAVFLMENARELIRGNFKHHFGSLERELRKLGYDVCGEVHMLNRFGLPQQRERALVIAAKRGVPLRTVDDLWTGWRVSPSATHVRRAIGSLPPALAGEAHPSDEMHVSPAMGEENLNRLRMVPRDGGSWADLRHHPLRDSILTPAMLRYIAANDFGSHPDVYGRMAWDRPAPTIKRECGHVGNGRYAHPDQDRLCTVREMSLLQGFPRNYIFQAKALTNRYRHIGDAVPPLISYQLAAICKWILTGLKPSVEEVILPNTHLQREDIISTLSQRDLFAG
jgi:DNA (cytosine-5)-methyltransferase 1